MSSMKLAERNLKEVIRDPLSLALLVALPALLMLVLQTLESVDEFFTPTMLAPGIALFGFVMLMFSSAMVLARDRESALFARLLTTPLRPSEFVAAYSAPYLLIGIAQGIVVYGIAAVLGLDREGNIGTVVLVMVLMAAFFVALGMVAGSWLALAPLSGAYSVVLLLTIFAGTWFDIGAIGGPIEAVESLLPFTHALDASRDVLAQGAGFGDVAGDITWVAGYTVAAIVLAVLSFRHRMAE